VSSASGPAPELHVNLAHSPTLRFPILPMAAPHQVLVLLPLVHLAHVQHHEGKLGDGVLRQPGAGELAGQ